MVERLRSALGIYHNSEDLIELGAYEKGSHPVLDKMIELKPEIDVLLRQSPDEHVAAEKAWQSVRQLARKLDQVIGHA